MIESCFYNYAIYVEKLNQVGLWKVDGGYYDSSFVFFLQYGH